MSTNFYFLKRSDGKREAFGHWEQIHIGKRTNHTFYFADNFPDSLEWYLFLTQTKPIIIDEYDRPLTSKEMWDIIYVCDKPTKKPDHVDYIDEAGYCFIKGDFC